MVGEKEKLSVSSGSGGGLVGVRGGCRSYVVALRRKYGGEGGGCGVLCRFNMWLCDRLGLVSVHDFDCFFVEMDGFMAFVLKRFKEVDDFGRAQSDFDRRVAERLHLDKVSCDLVERECFERGVYF